MKDKKAQAWGIDLFIGTIIFMIGILVFYFYTVNSPQEGTDIVERLTYDGKILSNIVLSEGFPANWNKTNVMNIGILTNNKINNTKLYMFYNITNVSGGYERSKRLFKTDYEYFFKLDEQISFGSINTIEIDGVGNASYGGKNATNLIKITRLVIYKDSPTTAYFYIWER